MASTSHMNPRFSAEDRAKSHDDWLKLTKEALRRKAREFNLKPIGSKETLATRIHGFIHLLPRSFSDSTQTNSQSTSTASAPTNSVPEPPPAISSAPSASSSTNMVTLSLGDLRSLMQEISANANPVAAQPQPQPDHPTTPNLLQISPASAIHPVHSPQVNPPPAGLGNVVHQPQPEIPAFNHIAQQSGNFAPYFNPPISSLPPLTPKIMKAMKDKEFIDLGNLLSKALYETAPHTSYSVQVNTGPDGDESVAMTPSRRSQGKIFNFSSWLEAWNVFIRGMVHFHPHLASELLAYQEHFCTLTRNYPFNACYKYDIAFRMNMARSTLQQWSRVDEYAFNRFLRCTPQQYSTACFKCNNSGHFAADCPSQSQGNQPLHNKASQSFRPQSQGFTSQTPCRHFNNNNSCTEPNCFWLHACFKCRGPHPGSNCPRSKK